MIARQCAHVVLIALAGLMALPAFAVAGVLGTNLVPDGGFESGTSGFTTPTAGDSATRSTSNPIDGTASLSVSLKSLGSLVTWSQAIPAGTSSSQFTVTAKLRPDTISSWATLQLCGEVVYSDELGTLQKCVPVPTVPGQVNALEVDIPLDNTKTVASVTVQCILRSSGMPVVFELDDVSAVLAP